MKLYKFEVEIREDIPSLATYPIFADYYDHKCIGGFSVKKGDVISAIVSGENFVSKLLVTSEQGFYFTVKINEFKAVYAILSDYRMDATSVKVEKATEEEYGDSET